jgi:signal transduction histidine kinase
MTSDRVKFLLVDDTDENLLVLEALLQRPDLEILKARSGRDALELLLHHDVALAFLDVQMTGMNGFELAESMRGADRTKHVPIIFVTAGLHDPNRVFKGYETGAVDFLHKPIEPHVLKGKADVFFDLYRQRRALADALRLNEMFVGILGHDLRNPLNAMHIGLELLDAKLKGEDDRRPLRAMGSAVQRMTGMIEQLRDLTRARLGGGLGVVRARKPVDVANLVQRSVEELRWAHGEADLRLVARGDATTAGDPDRLLQLFSNLVANAVTHGERGKPIEVMVEGAPTEIAVSVKNAGVISPPLLPTLFDPFRARDKPARRASGLGLGLYISQQIALGHSGTISVASTGATGTVFTVTLPRRAATAPVAERPASLLP